MATNTTTARRTRRSAAPAETTSPADTASPSTPPAGSELVHLDPRTLLVEGNIRTKADLDPQFLESVRQHGVLMPIVGTRTEQGVQVRYGQRRTLAAIEAGRELVPVVIVQAEDSDSASRIIQQWHENEHRAGLSVADQAGAAQQLTAFGLNAEQISQQLGAAQPRIDQALKVGASELATKAADRYDLTLNQAAVLAEFEGDKDVLTFLIAAAKQGPGKFEHAAQAARDARELAEKINAATAKVEKSKARLLTRDQARGATSLNELTASQDRKPITPAQHKKCPGNAAYVAETWRGVEIVYVCTDWRKHGHHSRWGTWQDTPVPAQMSPEEAETLTEQQREERRRVIKNNREWASATIVRHRFLKTFIARKTPAKGSAAFLAGELILGGYEITKAMEQGSKMLRELRGYKDRNALKAAAAAATSASDGRAQVLALAVVLAAHEEATTRDAWRRPTEANKRYLTFLVQNGYELSDVEQLVLGKPKPARKISTKATPPTEPVTAVAAPDDQQPEDREPATGAESATATDGGVAA